MQNGKNDLLLKGGRVFDTENRRFENLDIAVKDGVVAQKGPDLPADCSKKVIDASGCFVTPGLIDTHCHVYPKFPNLEDGLPTINADAHMFQSGVTTAVDAGTCGPRDFIRFKESVIECSRVRVLAFVNIASGGMVDLSTEQEPSRLMPELAAAVAKTFPERVVGIKTAHYWVGKPFDEAHPAWASVDSAVRAGELSGKPVMADFQPTLPGRPYADLILKKLRPGDIHTHVYAQQFPILDKDGRVEEAMFRARERGIVFDLGHGAASFWFRNAVPAYEQGFGPDTISTDLYIDNVAGPVVSMTNVMSKYLAIGMSLEEVVFRTTARPAQVLHHPELGTLGIGSCGDISVLKLEKGDFGFEDGGHARLAGNVRLGCVMTVRAGKIVFDREARSCPDWRTAPAPYWTSPGVLES